MQKVIGILLIIYILTACSTTRKAATADIEKSRGIVTLDDIENNNLLDVNFDITRADISYTDKDNSEELIAGISYRKESQYLISLRTKAGFEIGRILITKDTLLANDRLNRKLFYGSPLQFARKYGIIMDWLPILFGDLVVSESDKSIKLECTGREAKLEKKINSDKIVYYIDCSEEKVGMIEIVRTYGNGIAMNFGNFVETGGKKYPTEIEITDYESKTNIGIRIRKTEINAGKMIKFIPGAGYERIMLR